MQAVIECIGEFIVSIWFVCTLCQKSKKQFATDTDLRKHEVRAHKKRKRYTARVLAEEEDRTLPDHEPEADNGATQIPGAGTR